MSPLSLMTGSFGAAWTGRVASPGDGPPRDSVVASRVASSGRATRDPPIDDLCRSTAASSPVQCNDADRLALTNHSGAAKSGTEMRRDALTDDAGDPIGTQNIGQASCADRASLASTAKS